MNLPRINYIQPGPMAPEINAGAAAAPARGMMEIGRAIEGLGERGMRIAESLRESKEAKIRADVFNEIESEQSAWKNRLLQRSDYDNWTSEFDGNVAKWEGKALEKGLSPAGTAVFTEQFADWKSRERIGIETTAALKIHNDGRTAAGNTIARGIAERDTEKVSRGVNEFRRTGASPAEVEKVEYDSNGAINTGIIGDMIESDPRGWDERLKNPETLRVDFPGVSADDIERLRKRAEARTEELRREENDAIETKAMTPGGLKQSDIDGAAFLNDHDKAAWGKSIAESKPPTAEAESDAWKALWELRRHRDNPVVTQDEYLKAFNETRNVVLGMIPASYQGDIRKEFGYLSPAGRDPGSPKLPDNGQADVKAEAFAQVSRALEGNKLGNSDKEAPFEDREAAHRKAGDLRREIAREMPRIMKEKDPLAAARAFVDGKISGTRTNKAAEDARAAAPAIPGMGGSLRSSRAPVFKYRGVDPPFGSKLRGGGMVLPPKNPEDELNEFTDGQ